MWAGGVLLKMLDLLTRMVVCFDSPIEFVVMCFADRLKVKQVV